jgi:DNA adenine methylase
MKPVPNRPKHPVLTYYGGKWKLASWILSFFPAHQTYLEPCGGAASVLLNKPRCELEIFNDLDQEVVNFFKILRERPKELIRQIRLTPWARAEYELSAEPCEDDDLERARRFWIGVQMAISGSHGYQTGFSIIKSHRNVHNHPKLFDKDLKALEFAYERFAGVQIENLDALDCIRKYDDPETLIYFDPPYLSKIRAHTRYKTEAGDRDFHTRAAQLLNECAGLVVVSGYQSPLYTKRYENRGWSRFDKRSQTRAGNHKTESIWLSPRTVKALNQPRQMELL